MLTVSEHDGIGDPSRTSMPDSGPTVSTATPHGICYRQTAQLSRQLIIRGIYTVTFKVVHALSLVHIALDDLSHVFDRPTISFTVAHLDRFLGHMAKPRMIFTWVEPHALASKVTD